MTVESTIFAALRSLVSNRCYPNNAPQGCAKPYIVYAQVGGPSINFLEVTPRPDKAFARFQFNVWDTTAAGAKAVAHQVESALCTTDLQTTVEGQPVDQYDSGVELHGTMQDFTFFV